MYCLLRQLGLSCLLWGVLAPAAAQLTESPHPAASGRWLLEADVLARQFDRAGGDRFAGWTVGSLLFSTGVGENWDVQLGMDLFVATRVETGGVVERNRGLGDVWLRTKWRVHHDEGSGFAVALLPYLKLPTNTGGVGNGSVEGGIAVPVTVPTGPGWEAMLMLGFDGLRNAADDGHEAHWYATAAMARELGRRWGAYVELALVRAPGGNPAEAWAGLGLSWALSENRSWDFAAYRGLSRGALDWTHVLRFTLEF